MHPYLKNEIWKLVAYIAVSGIAGLIAGMPAIFISVSLLTYISFFLHNLFHLYNWITNNENENVPEASGLWGELFNEIYQLEKKTGSNSAKLANILKRFQEAVSALPVAMIILTKRNKIEWSNKAAHKLLSINHPQDQGQPISNLIRHPKFDKYLRKNDFGKTIAIPSPSNSKTEITLQVIPFGSSQKLIICRDVTHIIKLEEMRSHFVANVSHELRTPITVLSGYLETLQNVNDIKKIHSSLQTMHEQANRMESLVTDLLALSKLETQPTNAHSSDINISSLLLELKNSANFLNQEKKHTINFELDENTNLSGNRDELLSLFTNLINNAIRYTPEKGNIKIIWERDKDQAIFTVSDNGYGIPQQHIPHLTERFYRVDIDRSRESGGTGLGLAIVKHALERHDGKLFITSKLGEGSTFRCLFPGERILYKQTDINPEVL